MIKTWYEEYEKIGEILKPYARMSVCNPDTAWFTSLLISLTVSTFMQYYPPNFLLFSVEDNGIIRFTEVRTDGGRTERLRHLTMGAVSLIFLSLIQSLLSLLLFSSLYVRNNTALSVR